LPGWRNAGFSTVLSTGLWIGYSQLLRDWKDSPGINDMFFNPLKILGIPDSFEQAKHVDNRVQRGYNARLALQWQRNGSTGMASKAA
jgi:hypothetical protein